MKELSFNKVNNIEMENNICMNRVIIKSKFCIQNSCSPVKDVSTLLDHEIWVQLDPLHGLFLLCFALYAS